MLVASFAYFSSYHGNTHFHFYDPLNVQLELEAVRLIVLWTS